MLDSGLLLSSKLDLGSDNVLATCDSNHHHNLSEIEEMYKPTFMRDQFSKEVMA